MSFCFIMMTSSKIAFFLFRIGNIIQLIPKIAEKDSIRNSIKIILVLLDFTPQIAEIC